MQKALDQMNVQVHRVVTDLTGATGLVLRMAATSLQRSKTALGAAFRRIARHKGGAVAVFATARPLARLIYRMLRYGHDYVDIGETAYDHQFRIRRLAALTETARTLGYTLVPKVAAG